MATLERLITIDDIRIVRPNIDKNIVDADISCYIQEAQDLDLKPSIGDGLLIQLLTAINGTPTAAETLLLNGGTYVYGSFNYSFKGIKTILALFTYAKMIASYSFKFTPSGFVVKNSDVSSIVDDRSMSRVIKIAQEAGFGYRLELLTYLNRFTSTYSNFIHYNKYNNNSITIKKIGN